jgi:hypothetical protein
MDAVSYPEPKDVFAEVLESIVNQPHVLTPLSHSMEKEESHAFTVLQELTTEKLKDKRATLSNEYVEGLSPDVSFATKERIKSMEAEFNNTGLVIPKNVKKVTVEKLTEANANLLRSRTSGAKPKFFPFPDRRGFVKYCREQCLVVNQSRNIRIVPSGYNPWVYYVIMVPSTSYLSGTPIVGVMTLPLGFPRSAPTLTHFASVGTRFNVNYNIHKPFSLDVSTSCSTMVAEWGKNNLCHGCKECMKRSTSCNVCSSDECKALAAEHKEWDYYCTWDTILQSFLLFYITVYDTQIRHPRYHTKGYTFKAEASHTIKQTIMEQWAVYFQLIELFENHPDHFPQGVSVVYGEITDTRPLKITCRGGKMVSVPGVCIPLEVLAMGWKPKGREKTGVITYTSEPMSLERTNGEGYSVILRPGESLFTDSKDFALSFILSTEKPPCLHGVGRGVQRTLTWDICGYTMKKKPHSESRWSNHGSMLRQVFAVWLTFAKDQFVVAVQETEKSLPYVLSGVPVGRLSSVFRPQDMFYLNVIMKTKVPVKRFKLSILPVTKGVVCNWDPLPIPTGQAMYAALVVKNRYVLINAAKEYVDIRQYIGDSGDLEEKHPELHVGVDVYSLMRNTHSILGHTNDPEYENLLEHWKDYKSKTLSTELVVDAIHFDDNAVAFSVRSIEPPVKSLHDDFQHIVIGLMHAAGGPKYVSTHLRKSDTYKTIMLKEPLVINTRMVFSS